MRKARSHNENILNFLTRKGRLLKSSTNSSYLLMYAFLYKYLSDKLKNHLLHQFGADGDDLKLFYATDEGMAEIRQVALDDLGYFFEKYEVYIDQFIGDKFVDDLIDPRFLLDLKENIVFSQDNPCEEYFNTIIETVERQTRFYRVSHDGEQEMLLSNCLLYIAKLDIEESQFTFKRCYDLMASARQTPIVATPAYITQILDEIISSQRNGADGVYDPFMRDGANLVKVSKSLNAPIYGKESDGLNYFYTVIKAFIHEYDFNSVFLRHENAVKSMPFDDRLFDVIVSKIPNRFRHSSHYNSRQNLESPNPHKRDIKKHLISKYDLSELGEDKELLEALSVLEKKVEAVGKSNVIDFHGEYESLIDSEFLFLINMINCLKEDGVMAISVSQNFLFKKSLGLLRKFLTQENNYIDTIISLPEELGGSIRPEVIIVFRKNRKSSDVLFMDISKKYHAVASKNLIRGASRHNLILDRESLAKIVDVVGSRKPVDKFSQLITLRDLERNDFNLAVSRYVDTYDGEFIRIEDLKSEKTEIDNKIKELNEKIDLMMDGLDLK